MHIVLRRIRGALGMGLTWSVPWGIVGVAWGAFQRVALGRGFPDAVLPSPLRTMLATGLSWASYGFVLGTVFGGVLAFAGRRRTLEQLSMPRMALWGALAGTLLPIAFIGGILVLEGVAITSALATTGLSAALGAVCAAGTLKVARMGSGESAGRIAGPRA